MTRKGLKPGFRFGLEPPTGGGFREVMPFRRSWVAILVLAAMDAAFTWPAVFTFKQAMAEWSSFNSLFDLVAALFLSAWLLGWIIAPLLMTTILILMLFGREVLKAEPSTVKIFTGLPYVGVTASYDVSRMRNLRYEQPLKKSGKSWRGPHLVFDYGATMVAFGSGINADKLAELRSRLETATGGKIRHGDPLPDEINTKWEIEEDKDPQLPASDSTNSISAIDSSPLSLTSPTTLVLIAANLVPVAGSAFLGWNLADVMVLYWAESAVIGFFNICKMAVIGRWSALLAGPFFAGHFGAFMAVHFLFIYTIFVKGLQSGGETAGELAGVALLFTSLWPALAALFISHTFSFFSNFLGRREYLGKTVKDQMSEPYSRIIFMHLVLIFGGGVTMLLGSPVPVLIIMIALKILFDVKAHLKQHSGGRRMANPAA
jgi:hypothetical protein